MNAAHKGPLKGIRVIEIAGVGPGPFAGTMLADHGAEVIRIDRPKGVGAAVVSPANILRRNRLAVSIDLRSDAGRQVVLDLTEHADAIFEPFRPGVAERLGIGPDDCLARNPRLVYGRMTGWGQSGPLARTAGHDINYIAVAGALEPIGRAGQPPVPPLNLLGDFGGGGMLLAFGLVCALLEARRSGRGQVVDAAMVDGAALLTSMFHSLRALGQWQDERGVNELDTGSHYYQVYVTRDERYVAVGAIEPQFYAELLDGLGLDPDEHPQHDRPRWPEMIGRLADVFKQRSQAEWVEVFAGRDACVSPVLSLGDAPRDEHLASRGTFETVDGVVQPAPAPRYSRTPATIRRTSPPLGADTDHVLREVLGYPTQRVEDLRRDRVVL